MSPAITPHAPTIFFVEDDPDTRRFLALALDRAGYRSTVFADPAEALAALPANDCSLLLTDVRLPTMSGLELMERARALRPALPVVLMTAFATIDDTIVAVQQGADDYLLKPLTLDGLLTSLDAALAGRSVRGDRVLAIGAHPDDVEIGVGATLARHRRLGDQVTILTLSAGANGGEPLRRRDEAAAAAQVLGADLVMGSLPDTAIPDHGPTVALIEEVVASVDPTIVYTHSRHDVHQDHRAAYAASLVGCRAVPHLLSYQSPSATVEFAPNRFVAVDDDIDRKLAAIREYRSQTAKCSYLAEDLLVATTRYWGRFGGGDHAEPLEVIRDRITSTLPDAPSCTTPRTIQRKDIHDVCQAA